MTFWRTLGNFWKRNIENWIKIALLLILVLAAFLRFYRLDAQSLWADEGNSVSLSGRSLPYINAGAAHDIHPPLYYYLLHFWMLVFGNSEFVVRALSALLGIALVYLTYLLGRQLANYWLGLVAAFLSAVSPFQVYYSQEARMYILLAALSALSVYSFIRFLEAEASKQKPGFCAPRTNDLQNNIVLGNISHFADKKPGFLITFFWAGLYILATTLSLYTHYSFPIIIVMENLLYGIWLAMSWRRGRVLGRVLRWAIMQLAVVALYWPWLPIAYRQASAWPSISQPYGLLFVVQEAFRLFSLGPTAGTQHTSLLLLGFAAIFIAGAWPSIRPSLPGRGRGRVNPPPPQPSPCEEEGESTPTLTLPLRGGGNEPTPTLTLPLRGGGNEPTSTPTLPLRGGGNEPTPTPTLPLQGGGNGRSQSLIPHCLIASLPLLYCLFPVLMMYALSLLRPAYRPKFFLVGNPAFCLILAQGIIQLSNVAGKRIATRYLLPATCLIFISLASHQSLQNYYFDPQYARDDYRGIARYISALEKKGDAILLNAPNQWEIFTYYYKGDSPVYPLPRSRPLDEAQTIEELTEITAKHGRIFAVLWAVDESDPGRFVEGWLAERAYKALDTWYGGVRLAIYAVPTALPTGIQNPTNAKLGDEIALLGYNLLTREVEAGDILPLTLFWQALAQPQERYKVFVHVLDEAGHIVGQQDSEPGDGMNVTTSWQPGETVADNYGVLIRPGTPPGQHRIEVGMYSPISGQRLVISEGGQAGGDHLVLDSIKVLRPGKPPSLTALKMQHEVGMQYDDLILLGYNLYKLGYEHQPTEPLRPGDVVHLDLYWRAFRVPQDDWQLTLQLLDGEGNILVTQQAQPASVDYPVTSWKVGEIVRGQYDIFIPPQAPKGSYCLIGRLARLPDGKALRSPWVSEQFLVQ